MKTVRFVNYTYILLPIVKRQRLTSAHISLQGRRVHILRDDMRPTDVPGLDYGGRVTPDIQNDRDAGRGNLAGSHGQRGVPRI